MISRNMFGPMRGARDEDWRGWWGDERPYHFVTDGFDSALTRG